MLGEHEANGELRGGLLLAVLSFRNRTYTITTSFYLIQAHPYNMRVISLITALLALPAALASPIDFELDNRAGKPRDAIPHGSTDKF
jgi:hypothetical protein